MAIGVVVTVLLHAWLLLRYPAPFVDEAWYTSRAWGYLQTGKAFGMLDAGVVDRYPGYWTFLPWLSTVIQATALRISGTASLLAVRILSLLMGGVLLLAVFSIARRLGNELAAWLAVALVAFSNPFWYAAHSARYDIMVAMGGFGALALWFINEERPRWWLALLCGLIVGLTVEMHSFAAIYIPPLFGLFVQRYGRQVLRTPAFWWWVGGGAVSLLFYISMHILPYPASYVALTQIYFGATHIPPLLTFDLALMARGGLQTLKQISKYSFLAPLQLLAFGWLYVRPVPGSKRWLMITGPLLLAYIVLVRFKFGYYTIMFSPILEIGLALVIAHLIAHPPRLRSALLGRVLVAGLLIWAVLSAVVQVQAATDDRYADYISVLQQLDTVIQPDDVIMASPTYWFGFSQQTYYTIEQLVFYPRYAPGASVEQSMAVLKPDILIIDKQFTDHIFKEPPSDEYARAWFIPQAEVDAVIRQRGTLVNSFSTLHYNQIMVYRLNWQTP